MLLGIPVATLVLAALATNQVDGGEVAGDAASSSDASTTVDIVVLLAVHVRKTTP